MRYTTPDQLQQEYERRMFIKKFGLSERQGKRLTHDFVAQLKRCKSDEACRVLLFSYFPSRLRQEDRLGECGDTPKRKHYPALPLQVPLQRLEKCKDDDAREVLRAAYRRRKIPARILTPSGCRPSKK